MICSLIFFLIFHKFLKNTKNEKKTPQIGTKKVDFSFIYWPPRYATPRHIEKTRFSKIREKHDFSISFLERHFASLRIMIAVCGVVALHLRRQMPKGMPLKVVLFWSVTVKTLWILRPSWPTMIGCGNWWIRSEVSI